MPTTPHMSLILPTVDVTLGPEWATELNSAFETVDAHDHSPGKGLQVPSSGLALDADLPFNSYNATILRSVRFDEQNSPLAEVTDLACLYASGVDLWFNDGNGNQIQLTAGGALNAASIGGIGGDYATSTASVFYTDSTKTFTFWQNTNQSALMDCGTILLRKTTASSAAITIRADTSLSSGWTLTIPTAPPASTMFVGIDSSGNLAFTNSLVALTLSGALTVGGAAALNGAVTLSSDVTYGLAPISAYTSPTVSLVWTSTTVITMQTGRYFIGGKVWTLGSTIGWTWVASGQNGGLDTGSEASSTWYYLYAVLIGGAVGIVASATAPTAKFNTNLSGTDYDTNTYLGAFFNNSSSDISSFVHNGGTFKLTDTGVQVGPFAHTSFTAKTISVPTTANFAHMRLDIAPASAGNSLTVSSDNVSTTNIIFGQAAGIENRLEQLIPIVTAQTLYVRVSNGSDQGFLWPMGWMDKWL